MENIVLKLHYKANFVQLLIEDTDKATLIDVFNDMVDEAAVDNIELPRHPSLAYSYQMKYWNLRNDNDLMQMFSKLAHKKIIDIYVGADQSPCHVLVMARKVRANQRKGLDVGEGEDIGAVGAVGNVDNVGVSLENSKLKMVRGKLPCRRNVLKPHPEAEQGGKASSVLTPRRSSRLNKPQVCENSEADPDIVVLTDLEANNILMSLSQLSESRDVSPRRSERPNTDQVITSIPISPIVPSPIITRRTSPRFKPPPTVQTVQTQPKLKMARTTARRKGVYVPKERSSGVVVAGNNVIVTRSIRSKGGRSLTFSDSEESESDGSYVPSEEEDGDEGQGLSDLEAEDNRIISTLEYVDDDYNPYEVHAWTDEGGGYNAKLFKNGELYENKVFGAIRLKPWQLFMDKDHFKDVLRDFCVQEGFTLIVVKAESNRYTADCATANCGWRIHASVLPDGKTWAIKSIRNPDHGCNGVRTKNPMANCKWVAKKLIEDIRANPVITAQSVNDLLMLRYGLEMPKSSVYKMREMALKEINGGHDNSYRLLCQYCEMIKITNPGSVALASGSVNENGVLQFKSCFISFHAQIVGLIRGCRSLIGVDGAHLKGNYGGVLLSAVALDGNNEMFPIAVAVVASENKESWCFFFNQLKQLVNDSGRDDWTIISDRQKGVEPALETVWPEAYRRYCCRHLCKNFKQEHHGLMMHSLFWRVVCATSEYTFKKALELVSQHGGLGAARWFLDLGDKETWARYCFDPRLCCEDNTSNFVESFNATLGVHRCNPVLSMLEGIRRIGMVRHASRQAAADSWADDGICPNIINRLKVLIKDSRFCTAYSSGNGEFEVRDGSSFLPVNLNVRTCKCGAWQISGIPCKHAVKAILHAGREPADYVSEWFSVRRYREAYGLNFHPIEDSDQWPPMDVPSLEPPPIKRSIGRPARNRRREPGEEIKGKRSLVITCKKCGCTGHNSKTCKGGYTAKEKNQLQGKVTNKRSRVCQPSTSRPNFRSLSGLEALVMGSQASTSTNPIPNSTQGQTSTQAQSSQTNTASTTQGPQQRGRKRKVSTGAAGH